jgi:hypothetical protein
MKDRSLQAIRDAQQLGTTSMTLNAIPREIQQAGLDRAYNEFVGSDARKQGYVNSGLQMLGISTKAQVSEPSWFGDFMTTLGMGSEIASNVAGIFKPNATTPSSFRPTTSNVQNIGTQQGSVGRTLVNYDNSDPFAKLSGSLNY